MDIFLEKNPVMRVLRVLFDLIVLNGLWFLCSLPLVTLGASTSALHAVVLRTVRGEEPAVVKAFFSAFRRNFGQATLMGLIAVLMGAVVYADASFALLLEGWSRSLFLVIAAVVALLLLTFLTVAFPLQARFENKLRGHLLNALLLAAAQPFRLLAVWGAWLLPVAAVLVFPELFLQRLGFVWLLCGFSGPAYLAAFSLRKIFDVCTPGGKVE